MANQYNPPLFNPSNCKDKRKNPPPGNLRLYPTGYGRIGKGEQIRRTMHTIMKFQYAEENKAELLQKKKREEAFQKSCEIEAKLASTKQRNQLLHFVKLAEMEGKRGRIQRWESIMKKQREQLPLLIAKRKADEIRILEIVRKYAMIWLKKTREAMELKRKLDVHYSCFDVYRSLDFTMKHVGVITGCGKNKLGDIFGRGGGGTKAFMEKFKKAKSKMKQMIELEERQEE